MELPPEAAPPPAPPAPPPPPRFGAALAIGTLTLFFAAQIGAGILIVVVGAIYSIAVHGVNDHRALSETMRNLGPALVLVSALLSAATTALIARTWAWHLVRDRGRSGIGLVSAPARQLLAAGGTGAALSLVYLAIAQFLLPPHGGTKLGPLMQIAASGVAGRIVVAFVALLLAPPVEEFLFRGLLLKGFAESWGLKTAAVIVTVVFVLLHVPEAVYYWPALVAVAALSTAALAVRLITGSVFNSMALHAAYNAVMVAMTFIFM